MLAASFDLIHEARACVAALEPWRCSSPARAARAAQGEPYGGVALLLGIVLGGAFVAVLQNKLSHDDDMHFAALRGGDARKMMLMVAIMTAHAFGEGAGVGVSFAGRRGWAGGAAVAAAIALHNVPEGLAVASVLVAAGVSPGAATRWAVATHAPQAVVAVPAFLFVEAFRAMLPTAMGFAAGCVLTLLSSSQSGSPSYMFARLTRPRMCSRCMIWMAIAELLPDALAGASPDVVASVATLSATALEAFRMGLAWIEASGSGSTLAAQASIPSMTGLSSSMLITATLAAVLSGLMVALGGIAALTNIGASGSLRGDGARVLGAAHGAGMALGLLSLASASARGHGREAAVGAALGIGGAWGIRMQLRRSSRMESSAARAKDEEGGDDVAPAFALPLPPAQETRSALFVAAVSLAHASAEGLVVGAVARATGLAGESFPRMLLPGLLPGAFRGAVYAVGVYGITHSARAGFSLCLLAAFVQEVRLCNAFFELLTWSDARSWRRFAQCLRCSARASGWRPVALCTARRIWRCVPLPMRRGLRPCRRIARALTMLTRIAGGCARCDLLDGALATCRAAVLVNCCSWRHVRRCRDGRCCGRIRTACPRRVSSRLPRV